MTKFIGISVNFTYITSGEITLEGRMYAFQLLDPCNNYDIYRLWTNKFNKFITKSCFFPWLIQPDFSCWDLYDESLNKCLGVY